MHAFTFVLSRCSAIGRCVFPPLLMAALIAGRASSGHAEVTITNITPETTLRYPVALLLKRSVAEKGAHVGSE